MVGACCWTSCWKYRRKRAERQWDNDFLSVYGHQVIASISRYTRILEFDDSVCVCVCLCSHIGCIVRTRMHFICIMRIWLIQNAPNVKFLKIKVRMCPGGQGWPYLPPVCVQTLGRVQWGWSWRVAEVAACVSARDNTAAPSLLLCSLMWCEWRRLQDPS